MTLPSGTRGVDHGAREVVAMSHQQEGSEAIGTVAVHLDDRLREHDRIDRE